MSDHHDHTIVLGLLQKPSRLSDVMGVIGPDFLIDPEAKKLYSLILHYQVKNKGKVDLPLALSILERAEGKLASRLLKLAQEYEGMNVVSDAEFRDGIVGLVQAKKRQALQDHGTEALDAVLAGDAKQAERVMRRGLALAEDLDLDEDQPINIREKATIDAERDRLKNPGKDVGPGFDVGFPTIQKRVSLRRKELVILGGYAADGKTHLSKTLVYNANQKGARVLFVALEMTKQEMLALFVCQHAYTLIDPSKEKGVSYRDILDGTETKRDRILYERALDDFEDDDPENPEGGTVTTKKGAALHIWSPRRQPTMDRYSNRVRSIAEESGLDIVVADYLELIQPTRPTGQYRLDIKDLCDEGKYLARDVGILHIMNHQISRLGRDAAEKRKPVHYYLLRDLGESSGVEKAADVVLWVYVNEELKRTNQARLGIAKARKGSTLTQGLCIFADYAHGYMADEENEESPEPDEADPVSADDPDGL